MKEIIKELRLSTDFLAQIVHHQFANASHPLDDCRHALLLAKAWAGKLLGSLGEETPYKNDGNRKTVADIEPTDSRATGVITGEMSDIERIDWLRQQIGVLLTTVDELPAGAINTRQGSIARTQIEVYLTESRFHLGFELERIRYEHLEAQKNSAKTEE